MAIDWRQNEADQYELISADGQYRILKNPRVFPVEYTPMHLRQSINKEGVTVQGWERITKPKTTCDEAKAECELCIAVKNDCQL